MDLPIPLDSPSLTGNEREYLNRCIDTNWISWQGEFVSSLENQISNYCNTKYRITIVNGTYSLIVALQALGISKDDEVIVPTLTMSASVFAISEVGAIPVFVDCSPNSLTLDPNEVKKKITNKTKAVMAVHLYGYSADMIELLKITNPLGIPVIEDAAESFGSTIENKPVGGWGTIACHSFHNKIIGAGEGGAITVNDENLYQRVLDLRTPPPNNVNSKVFALNNRMSNVAAALALAQLERVNELIQKRRDVATLYNDLFDNNQNIITIKERSNERSVYWRYQVLIDNNQKVLDKLKEKKIEARPIFTLMSHHYLYNDSTKYINAEYISSKGIDLPSGPNLTVEQVKYVANTIIELL